MKKDEIFKAIVSATVNETGVTFDIVKTKSKVSEVVDARYILVKLLFSAGFYPFEISSMVNITRRSVNHILTNFESRKQYGKMLRNNYEQIRKFLRNNNFDIL